MPDVPETPAPPAVFRAGLAAIVGRANTGKSSLLNALIGEKVAVVSPVAQTTRRPVRAIHNEPGLQIVFLDTPGIRQATHSLSSMLNRTARGLVTGSDVVLLLLDASLPPQDEDRGWMQKLAADASPVFAVLNKTDLLRTDDAPGGSAPPRPCAVGGQVGSPTTQGGGARPIQNRKPLRQDSIGLRRAAYETAWIEVLEKNKARNPDFAPPPLRWFETSAATGAGLPELLAAIKDLLPAAEPLFPTDMLTDDPGPFFIADVIRAQINVRLKAELPHAIAVAVDQIEETEEQVNVSATIFVEKNSQRPIVIGQRAKMIRDIRHAAQKELAAICGKPHRLELWVKVEPNWSRNYWMLKKFGYVGA